MAHKDIYSKAFDLVSEGNLSKEDFLEVLEDYFNHLYNKNSILLNFNKKLRNKYNNLLRLVNNAAKEHNKLFND